MRVGLVCTVASVSSKHYASKEPHARRAAVPIPILRTGVLQKDRLYVFDGIFNLTLFIFVSFLG